MENIFVTPVSLWKGYDPGSLPLAVNIVKETRCEKYSVRETYFNGGNSADGSIRGYGRFVYIDQKPRPAVLILRAAESRADIDDYIYYINEGYNIFILDYAGNLGQGGKFTLYPPSRAFSNLTTENRKRLFEAEHGPVNTCWYDWAALSARAITLLISFFEVKSSAIIVHGEKEGGAIAWMLAAIDDRIAGSIMLFEAGWNTSALITDEDPTGAKAAYVAALSPQAYAQTVKKPVLFLGASNERGAAFDRINDTFMRLPADIPSYISIAPRLSGQLSKKNVKTGLLFIKQCISNETLLPKRPAISVKASENKLYYVVKADEYEQIKKIKIYCSGNENNPEIRNWTALEPESTGGGEYITKADIYNPDANIFAFANIEYTNGALLSTATLSRIPKSMGVAATNVTKSRLFYDKSMGVDSFFAVHDGFVNNGVTIKEGPVQLSGVTAIKGSLATYKPNDLRYKGESVNSMQFTLYTANKITLTVTAEERADGRIKRFFTKKELPGAEFWQKIVVSPNELKSPEGIPLAGWKNVVLLMIDGEGVIVNTMIWV